MWNWFFYEERGEKEAQFGIMKIFNKFLTFMLFRIFLTFTITVSKASFTCYVTGKGNFK